MLINLFIALPESKYAYHSESFFISLIWRPWLFSFIFHIHCPPRGTIQQVISKDHFWRVTRMVLIWKFYCIRVLLIDMGILLHTSITDQNAFLQHMYLYAIFENAGYLWHTKKKENENAIVKFHISAFISHLSLRTFLRKFIRLWPHVANGSWWRYKEVTRMIWGYFSSSAHWNTNCQVLFRTASFRRLKRSLKAEPLTSPITLPYLGYTISFSQVQSLSNDFSENMMIKQKWLLEQRSDQLVGY